MIKIKLFFQNGYTDIFIPFESVEVFEVRHDVSGEPQQYKIITKSGKEYTGVVKFVENFDKVYRKFGS